VSFSCCLTPLHPQAVIPTMSAAKRKDLQLLLDVPTGTTSQ
jgi:hypothetical protein